MVAQFHPNKIRQVLFLLVIIAFGYILFKEMYFLLSSFLGAITLYIIMRNQMIQLVVKRKWKKWAAALFLIFISIILIVLPTIWIISIGFNRISPLLKDPSSVTAVFDQIHNYLTQKTGLDILNKENVSKLSAEILPILQKTISNTFSIVGSLFFMFLILFFMLIEIIKVEAWIKNSLPFKESNIQLFLKEFQSLVYSNAVGIPIVAIIQGLVGFVGYLIFGVEDALLMGLLTAICSVIPVVGSMLIYLPLGILLLAQNQTTQAIGLLLWGFLVIGSVDNLARFLLQKKMANIHPLITLLGVFVGVNLFGFLGIIFGPLFISMFLLLVKIYSNEFGKWNDV